jgi:nitrogen regulatory protein PII
MSWQNRFVFLLVSLAVGGAYAAGQQPRALGGAAEKGLQWLVEHQLPNGAWGQGEESAAMGGGQALRSVGSVADTGMSAMALLRSGSSPSKGRYQRSVARAVDYVLSQLEEADEESLYVTSVRGTRVQGKIGPYIDTFVAATFLAEVKNQMPDASSRVRVEKALAKILRKIRRNQQGDGSFSGAGWAPVLSQGMAAKGINRAAQAGVEVPPEVQARAEEYAKKQFDRGSGGFGAGTGNAGVGLYGAAATVGSMQDSVNTNEAREAELRKVAREAKAPAERDQARQEIQRYESTKQTSADAKRALVQRLEDPSFVAGFGSNGGEEFLSYMMVSEALAAKGGAEWEKWNTRMATLLARAQNADGSWTGHHCITGRTFCTAAALLVLMADRAPIPTIQGPAAG